MINDTGSADSILIRMNNNEDKFILNKKSEFETLFKNNNIEILSLTSINDLIKILTDHLELMISFLILMSIAILSIGCIGLMITMSINIMERTKEIGISRSIGASDKSLMFILIVEGVVIGILSWILSVIISFPISMFVGNKFSNIILNSNLIFLPDIASIFIWLFVVIIFGAFASFLSANRALESTIRDTIVYE